LVGREKSLTPHGTRRHAMVIVLRLIAALFLAASMVVELVQELLEK
jgi:hypothetical protein